VPWPGRPQPGYRAWAAAGASALQRWYAPARGLWRGAGWWQSANALTALTRYIQVTGDRAHAGAVAVTFRRAPRWRPGFANRFYDDNGWWALAWVAAFDLDRDPRYLAAAAHLFARNTGGWDAACGGGLWWNTSRRYKNAITNELFLTLAARLSLRTADPGGRYRAWALRAGDWFLASGLIGPDGLVNDGLTAGCANNGRTAWTYNQGVILSGLAALYQLTGDPGYLDAGDRIANAALSALTTPAGILAEPSERPGLRRYGDDTQFKGIFLRGLHDFCAVRARPAYREFILGNAHSLWQHSRNADNQFGMRWSGPFDQSGASLQSSALDGLTAAAALAGGATVGQPFPGH
jgi:predicted alpha-1,6-mannanase (GH76 family)